MKKYLVGMVAVGLLATPVWAGVTIRKTPLDLNSYFNNGFQQGYRDNALGGPAGPGLFGGIYNNIPTAVGGPATPGSPIVTTGGATIPAGFTFVDWVGTVAAYGDDLQMIQGPVVTSIWYRYTNDGGFPTNPSPGLITGSHLIKLYDNVTPGTPPAGTITAPFPLLTVIAVPGLPGGTSAGAGFAVTVGLTGLSIALPSSNAWITFNDPGAPGVPWTFNTFWYTGGIPAIGTSANGILYSYQYPPPLQYFVPGPLNFGTLAVQGNIAVGLNIPAPGVMALLGLGGLVSLRRRRSRA
jgi:hypothetical protein